MKTVPSRSPLAISRDRLIGDLCSTCRAPETKQKLEHETTEQVRGIGRLSTYLSLMIIANRRGLVVRVRERQVYIQRRIFVEIEGESTEFGSR